MPKLIDADKLLKWLGTSELGDIFYDGALADYFREQIDAGTFDPTPPVQPDTGEVIK